MTVPLTPIWERWRRDRQAELIAGGMRRSVAKRWARAEAIGRQRIARMAGHAAAANAELDYVDKPDGSTTWLAVLDLELVPAERRAAVQEFLAVKSSARASH